MVGLKAPIPDGIDAEFYQQFWDVVQNDVFQAIQYFFTKGHMLREWNNTHICLIPKVDMPYEAGQFALLSYATSCTRLYLRTFLIG